MGMEIKSLSANGQNCFRIYAQIHHLVTPLYPNEANKPGYGQLYISDSAEATKNGLKTNQMNGVMPK
jgi:hypothetical protein